MTVVGTAVKSTLVLLSEPLLMLPKLVSLVIFPFFCSITLPDKATSSRGSGTYFFASNSIADLSSDSDIFVISITDVNTELFGNEATILFVVTPALRMRVLRVWAAWLMAVRLSLFVI